MRKLYRVNEHNSTICGYPGRDFDWEKFDWEGKSVHKAIFKGDKDLKAPKPFVDDGLIAPNCQYLHVPYNWAESSTVYRVRPNDSMYAGEIYRGHLIKRQTAFKRNGIWYWRLEFSNKHQEGMMNDVENKLVKLKGLKFTAKQMKKEFGYSPRTYIKDTILYRDGLIEEYGDDYPRLWRIK